MVQPSSSKWPAYYLEGIHASINRLWSVLSVVRSTPQLSVCCVLHISSLVNLSPSCNLYFLIMTLPVFLFPPPLFLSSHYLYLLFSESLEKRVEHYAKRRRIDENILQQKGSKIAKKSEDGANGKADETDSMDCNELAWERRREHGLFYASQIYGTQIRNIDGPGPRVNVRMRWIKYIHIHFGSPPNFVKLSVNVMFSVSINNPAVQGTRHTYSTHQS